MAVAPRPSNYQRPDSMRYAIGKASWDTTLDGSGRAELGQESVGVAIPAARAPET